MIYFLTDIKKRTNDFLKNLDVNLVLWHGSTKEKAHKILQEKEFVPSKREADWLGNGIYFWEESHEAAYYWTCRYSNSPVEKGSVKVYVKIKREELLDLVADRWEPFLKYLSSEFEKHHGRRINPGTLFNLLCKELEKSGILIKALKGTQFYNNKRPVIKGTGFYKYKTQVCLRCDPVSDKCLSDILFLEMHTYTSNYLESGESICEMI